MHTRPPLSRGDRLSLAVVSGSERGRAIASERPPLTRTELGNISYITLKSGLLFPHRSHSFGDQPL